MKKTKLTKVRFDEKDVERLRKMKAETGIDMSAFILAATLKELRKQGY